MAGHSGGDRDSSPPENSAVPPTPPADVPSATEPADSLGSASSVGFGLPVPARSAPERVGPYRLIERLGQGTFGEVHLAEREDLSLRAAIKLLQPNFGTDEEVFKRFEVEREALAQLDHPGIAKIYDAGRHVDDRPWYAMEYIAGRPIHQYCDEERLTVEARLVLFREVCEAIQHAHARGVIHRDLKPQHIIVVENDDGSVTPKVIDYGLAKTSRADVTVKFRPIGTPEYMSPEQVDSSKASLEIDPRPDVFALGTILFELLVGSRPLRFEDRNDFDAVRRVILDQVAPPLAARFAGYDEEKQRTIAEARATSPNRLASRLADDLDRLVAYTIEKDSNLRCQSATELAHLIGDVLAFRPLPISTPSRRYLLRRFLRRNRAPALAVSAVVLSLGLGFLISTVLLVENRRQSRRLQEEADVGSLVVIDETRLETPLSEASVSTLERLRDEGEEIVDRLPTHRATLERLLDRGSSESRRAVSLGLLVDWIEEFSGERGGLADLRRRIEVSRTLRERSLEGEAAIAWQEALAAIRDPDRCPKYRNLPRFEPQMGLVPIGRDEKSGLYEFWHVASGQRPERGANGRWVIESETGIVLVLLPGGRFWMGGEPLPGSLEERERQALETARPFLAEEEPPPSLWSEYANLREAPARPVTLSPYFIGKYETTGGQWTRWNTPPEYATSDSTPVTPITYVRRSEAVQFLSVLGLVLPTEAQWENAARGESTGDWYRESPRDLIGHFNLADLAMRESGTILQLALGKNDEVLGSDFRDGSSGIATVGSFAPNPFGLHDVYGNAWEWCADDASPIFWQGKDGLVTAESVIAHRTGDGFIVSEFRSGGRGIVRGGAYQSPVTWARSAFRYIFEIDKIDHDTGFRAARPLELPTTDDP